MFGVIGEDKSDVESLKVLIKRIASDNSLTVRTKGFSGCGEMLRKGASHIRLFERLGMSRFIICYDADGADPDERRNVAISRIAVPAGVTDFCIVVPVQEIESWILADLSAVTNVILSWRPEDHGNPESVADPKEQIERMSRGANKKPRYSHATHNPIVVRYLDLDKIYQKCPSFRPLRDFVSS